MVDHVVAHEVNQELFWDRRDWQPLCKACHDRKTATGGDVIADMTAGTVNSQRLSGI